MLRLLASCLALLAIVAAPAAADTGVVEEDGVEIETPEHVVVSLASATWLFETPIGHFTCDEVDGEATLTEVHVDGPTEVGQLNELDFYFGGDPACPTTFPGIIACDPTFGSLPAHLTLDPNNPGPALLVLNNQELHLLCETLIGDIECHFASAQVTAEIQDGTNLAVLDDHFALTAGSFLCPSEMTVEATLQLNDEDGGEITYESTK